MMKIMVVGDAIDPTAHVVTILTNYGYAVEAISSGEEAWGRIIAAPDSYMLVISNAVLPDITGIALSARIRGVSSLDRVRIILLGVEGDKELMFAYRAGVDMCLLLPINPDELISFSRRCIEEHKAAVAIPRCFECNKLLSEIPLQQELLASQLDTLIQEVAVCLPNQGWFLFCCQDHAKVYEWKHNLRFPRDRNDQIADIVLLSKRVVE